MHSMIKGLITCMLVAPAFAQQTTTKPSSPQSPPPSLTVQQFMSQAEFQKAGLNKLSPEELLALNRWFETFTGKLYRNLTSSPSTASVIESCIEGDFEGWDGETIFKLDNGQIWQQDSYDYTYHYAYRPKVLIYRSGGVYKMKVEDVEEAITVKRLK